MFVSIISELANYRDKLRAWTARVKCFMRHKIASRNCKSLPIKILLGLMHEACAVYAKTLACGGAGAVLVGYVGGAVVEDMA
jgi:hypothetical protein